MSNDIPDHLKGAFVVDNRTSFSSGSSDCSPSPKPAKVVCGREERFYVWRTSGDVASAGTLAFEDRWCDGIDWTGVVFMRDGQPVINQNRYACRQMDAEPGWDLTDDLNEAAREFLASECDSVR